MENYISFKLLSNSKGLYQSTVGAKSLDQGENIVGAEDSMLIESLGHYYKEHGQIGMLTLHSAPFAVFKAPRNCNCPTCSTQSCSSPLPFSLELIMGDEGRNFLPLKE